MDFLLNLYIFNHKENRLFVKLILSRTFVGIFVGIFLVKRIFFNDISKSGGRHLHQHAFYVIKTVFI